MSSQPLDEQAIFHAARQIDDPVGRRTYLQQVCGDDAALRARIDALLHVHDQEKDFLARSPFVTTDQPMAEKPGTMVGPYKLLQQIGEGGFGVVYMAEQTEPVRRKVAVKVIKPGMDTRQVIARFEAERQALAVMDHTNIARVMDAGATESGRPYFVMELVRGVPITEYCDEHHLPVRERLALFASVCQAIQHAHTKGIIHRDIKPTNILVTRQDGRPTVKVIDFGIAKAMGQQLTEKTLFTDFAQMIGTPLYMSPEQAELSGVDIDTRSDIYSLGVLLYELLTGSTPVDKQQMKQAAFDEVRRMIREDEPQKPSTRISTAQAAPSIAAQRHTEPAKLARLVRGELDWIAMKALEKDRNRRYETANGLALDVERYLNDEHVQAYPPSTWYRLRKFARRNKRVLLTAAVLAISALVMAATLTLSAVDYGLKQRALAEQKETLRQESATGLYHALLRHAAALRTARQPGFRSQVWKNLHEAAALDTPVKNLDDIRREVLACLDDPIGLDAIQSPKVKRPAPALVPQAFQHLIETIEKGLGGARVTSAVTQDGETWATARRQDGVTLWGNDGRALATAKPPLGYVHALKFSRDGELLIGGCEEGTIVWTVPGLATRTFFRGDVVRSMAIDHTGQLLATAGNARRIELWSLTSNRLVAVLPARSNYDVEFDAEGEFLLTLSDGTPTSAWRVKRTPEKHQLAGHRAGIPGVAFSPDGRSLASVSKDRTVKIWDAELGRLVHTCLGHNAEIQALAFSPDGKLLATGDWKGDLRLWDPASGDALAGGRALGQIWELRFDASGRWLATAGAGGLMAWAVQQGADTTKLEPFLKISLDAGRSNAIDLALHPGGSQLVFLRWDDRQLYTYNLARPTEPRSLNIQARLSQSSLHFDSAGNQLRFVTPEGALGAWDWHKAAPGRTSAAAFDFPSLTLSPDGRWAAGEGLPGRVVIYDLLNDRELFALPPEANRPWCLDWSSDGKRLAVGLSDGGLAIWDLEQVRARLAEFGIAVPSTSVRRSPLPNTPILSKSAFEQIVINHKAKQQADAEKAVVELREAIRLRPDDAESHHQLGEALQDSGRLDEALAAYKEAIRLEPENANAHNNLGVGLGKKGQLDEAIAAYKEAIRLNPDSSEAHYNLGNVLQKKGQLDEAIAAFKGAIRLNPGSSEAHYNLGNVLQKKGQLDEAIAAFKEAIRLNPDSSEAHNNLGAGLGKKGQLDEAIAAFKEAIRLNPDSSEAHNNLGLGLGKKGQLDEAIAACKEAIRLEPENAAAHNNLGLALADKGELDEAIAACKEAIRLEPENAAAHNSLGLALADKGELDEAIAACKEAIRLKLDYAAAHNNLGNALQKKGRLDEAIAAYKEAIRLEPGDADAHNNLGSAFAAKGQLDEAIAAFNEAIRLKSNDAHNNLAWLLATCPDPKFRDAARAVELAKKAVEPAPKQGTFWNTLGAAHYRAGDWKAAIETFDQSMELREGGDSFDWFFLAMVHWQLGHQDQARTWHDQAVAWMDQNAPDDPELRRFRAEAQELLGMTDSGAKEEQSGGTDDPT